MNLRTFLSAFLLLILLLASCNKKEENQHALPAPMEEIDTTSIKKSLLREIKAFVDKQDSCKTFILYSMQLYKMKKGAHNDACIGCRDQFNELFCIREAADLYFGEGEFTVRRNYPHKYIDLNGKIVFVSSENDGFYDQEKLKAIYNSCKLIEDRVPTMQTFLVYDLKDSCETIQYPCYSDSTYEYKTPEGLLEMVEIVKSPIKFTAPDI